MVKILLTCLHSKERGAHSYWGRGGQFPARPEGLINLLHYEDAARAALVCLETGEAVRGKTYLVSDGCPLSRSDFLRDTPISHCCRCAFEKFPVVTGLPTCRQEIMAACAVTNVEFTGGPGEDGKRYNTEKIRQELGWNPQHSSFTQFMQASLLNK